MSALIVAMATAAAAAAAAANHNKVTKRIPTALV